MKKLVLGCAVVVAVAVGCKKKEGPAASGSATAPVAAPAEGSAAAAPAAAPAAAGDADCTSTDDFKSVDACVALCDATGHPNACYVAGQAYLVGDKVDDDEAKAGVYFTKGCAQSSAFACKWLAPMYKNGLGGIPADPAKAQETFAKARTLLAPLCDANDPQACNDLSALLASDEGGAADPEKAKALAKKACDLGKKGACDRAK